MTRLRTISTSLLAALALSACSLSPKAPSRAIYDLGPARSAQPPGGAPPWRIADVTAPPWLASDGIAYRLVFKEAQRIEHYRDSAWAAAPAALLTQRLREALAAEPGCAPNAPQRLTVHLDQFEQVFSSPTHSQAVLRVHATLTPAGPLQAPLQQHWQLQRPAATPDAAGAVSALAGAVDDWLPQLNGWLAASCR